MYELINKAIRQFVEREFKAEIWDDARKACGVTDDSFPNFEYFPDDVTYDIVARVSERTGGRESY